MPILSGNVFFPPENSGCNVNIDLKGYATKAELKAVTGVDTTTFAKSTDLTKIKESVDKIEKSVPVIRDSVIHLDTKVKKNSTDQEKLKKEVDDVGVNFKNYVKKSELPEAQEFLKNNEINMMIVMGRIFFVDESIANEFIFLPQQKYFTLSSPGNAVLEWRSSGNVPYSLSGVVGTAVLLQNNRVVLKDGSYLSGGGASKINSEVCNFYIVYNLDTQTKPDPDTEKYPLVNCLFSSVNLTKHVFRGIKDASFDGRGVAMAGGNPQDKTRNVIIFGVNNSDSKNAKNKKHDILVLGKNSTKISKNYEAYAERDLSINMTYPGKTFVLSIHYVDNGVSSMYVNGILMTDFKSKPVPKHAQNAGFILGALSDSLDTTERKNMNLNGLIYEFSLDYKPIDKNNIKNIHAYLMKKHNVDNNFPTDTKKLFH